MNQLSTLFISDVTAFLDAAEEQGLVTAAAIAALALDHELDEDDLERIHAELAARGISVEDPAEDAAGEPGLDLSFDPAAGGVPDSLTLFMNEVGRWPLLTAAEEVQLAKRVERGDRAAKERMINSNLRLVVHVAHRYAGHGVSLGDLVQEGVIGLNRAVEKFDWRRGFKFSTYATWWIRQACQRAIANQSKTIRIPVHVDERRKKLARARDRFTAANGREPSIDELAAAAELQLRHVEEALEAVEASTSLNQTIGDDQTELGSLLADRESVDPHEAVEDELRRGLVERALKRLPERERRVVELRFGLDCDPSSLEEIGRELGVSRERVRQLEQDALARLAGELETAVGPGADALGRAA